MKNYLILTENGPEIIVIHCGTNYLRKEVEHKYQAQEIANLGISAKTAKMWSHYLSNCTSKRSIQVMIKNDGWKS